MTEETERGEKRRRIRLARDKEVARNVEEPRPMCTVCKVSLRRGESRRPFPLRRASVSRILLFRRPCVDQEPRGREEGNARKRKKDRLVQKVVALQLPRKTPPRVSPEKLLCLTNHSRLNENTSLRSRDSSSIPLSPISYPCIEFSSPSFFFFFF